MSFQGPQYPGPPAPTPQSQATGCKLGLLGCGLGCPAIALGCFTVFAAFAFAIVWFVFALIRGSEPYATAVSKAQADTRVREALGTPVQTGWWVMGSMRTSGSSGKADLTIPLYGPKASGKLYVDGWKSAGKWSFRRMEVEVAGGGRIDLLGQPRGLGSPGEAEAPAGASPSPRGSPGEW